MRTKERLSDQLHGAKTHAKTRPKTRAIFVVALNCDKTTRRRYWRLSHFGAEFFVEKIV